MSISIYLTTHASNAFAQEKLVAKSSLQAGADTIDITPPIGYPMWGYAARHATPSDGVLDALYARAVVLEIGEKRIGIVSLDLGRPPTRKHFAHIQKEAKQKLQIETLFLVASHTHHGPVLELEDWPPQGQPYVSLLNDKILKVLKSATTKLQEAKIGTTTTRVNWNRNRHTRTKDASVDDELIVVRLENSAGKAIAHLVNFAAHPTMLPTKLMKFSADFPGVLAKTVEKETNAPCLFLQGASGDLSPNPGKDNGYEAFGNEMATEVLAILKDLKCKGLKTTKLETHEREFRFSSRIDHANPIIQLAFSTAFFPELVTFYVREYREGIRPRLTLALLDNQIGLVGVSGEVFCEHARSLKMRANVPTLLFFGCCNDYQQYFPTIQAVAKGGYGADPEVAPVEVGAGEQIMNYALIQLFKMRGLIRTLR